MSNPTTPFSWQMPTATDLVTDLPADFEVFGQAVATSMADLLGGTTGQILAKNSATDMDFVWIANDQGDITGVTAGTGITVTSPTGPVPTISIDTATTVDKTTAQTLTNKTLTAPIISTISNTGTLSLPSSTDTLVGRATTDTLTNKTLTAPVISSPKISSTYSAKTAAYTFASGDEGNIFSMNNAATQQFNIPTDATFNFAVGTEINVFWITGAGQPTIGAVTPGTTTVISTGATSATPKLRVVNSGATCKKLAANSWIVFGDIS
jgi:hypothetical protein